MRIVIVSNLSLRYVCLLWYLTMLTLLLPEAKPLFFYQLFIEMSKVHCDNVWTIESVS